MDEKETAKAIDDASSTPQGSPLPQQRAEPEATILEEHVVAPAQPTPSAPPVATAGGGSSNAPTPLQQRGNSDTPREETGYIQSLLEKVKLPERRNVAAPQPSVFDTTLSTKSTEERKAAEAAATGTARAITEKMTMPVSDTDVRALHTLKDDLQHVVRESKISLVRAVALEEEKRHHGGDDEHLEIETRQQKRSRYSLFVAALLFGGGVLAIGAVLYVMAERTQKSAAPISAAVLFSEQSVPLPIDNLAAADIRREIGNARSSGSLTLGAILQIIPVTSDASTNTNSPSLVSFAEFLQRIGANAPEELSRSLSDEFFIGLHTVDENAPLIVVPVISYERAFAAMLEWEKNMNSDLAPIFTLVPLRTTGDDGIPRLRQFEDAVLHNYDVRVLKDARGEIQLYYSFPTRNVLIIAESPYSFGEILSRLRADRKL